MFAMKSRLIVSYCGFWFDIFVLSDMYTMKSNAEAALKSAVIVVVVLLRPW